MKIIGSLFAGIGGFDLGFEREGFTTSWAVEIDQKAQAVLRRHFPSAALHDDVCQVGAHNLGPVDVVTFGSPCQDLSVAGKRAGLAGERSGLFHESARIIRELRSAYGKPDFAIWENVPGAFSSNAGRDFAAVIQAMVDIGARDVAWRVLDSRFAGVAQRRRRVFLVADFGGERAAEVLALAEGVRGNPPKGRKARQGIASGAGTGFDERGIPRTVGALTDGAHNGGGLTGRMHTRVEYSPRIANPLTARMAKGINSTLDEGQTPVVIGGHFDDSNKQPIGLDKEQNAMINCFGTLMARMEGGGFEGAVMVPQGTVVRRLTPVECCRLQGFPDDWNTWGISKDGKRVEMADSSRYKQLGNAVTANVAQRIARRVMAAISSSALAQSC
jgi:DNA (cytosine-5)-methyltransferase 1